MIVLANGCFDVFHYGHLMHLREAKEHGILYVSVTRDQFVNKGLRRPAFPERERLAVVQELRIVTYAFLCSGAQDALQYARPSVYIKGAEYEGNLPEQAWCEEHGIKVIFTHGKVYSSTALLNYYA